VPERFTTWWAFATPAGQQAASPGRSVQGLSPSVGFRRSAAMAISTHIKRLSKLTSHRNPGANASANPQLSEH
jgi:hypothetical protein